VGLERTHGLDAQSRFLSTRHEAHSDKANHPRYRLESRRRYNGWCKLRCSWNRAPPFAKLQRHFITQQMISQTDLRFVHQVID